MNWIKIFVCLLCIIGSSYVSFDIPVTETGIPFTLQSLMVFVVAGMMNSNEAKICLLLYIILGIIGLPVFADGSSGIEKVAGPSGGFIYGFYFSGWFIASMIADYKPLKIYNLLFIFLIATIVLFVFGLGHLAFKFGFDKAMEYGLYPFWKMALVKAVLATLILALTNRSIID